MIVQTSRFGKIEVSEEQIITMQTGLLGFSSARLYALLDDDISSPFEIPIDRVMELLAASKVGNISVSPGLKFYPTTNENFIRACPKGSAAFAPVADRTSAHEAGQQTGCFYIETRRPVHHSAKNTPSIL